MPIMNSGLSRTGSMIEMHRSWYACATSQAMEFVVRGQHLQREIITRLMQCTQQPTVPQTTNNTISWPVLMNSGLSRTGSMIEMHRSWYACATSQAMEFVVRDLRFFESISCAWTTSSTRNNYPANAMHPTAHSPPNDQQHHISGM
jgi:hypothetical protein